VLFLVLFRFWAGFFTRAFRSPTEVLPKEGAVVMRMAILSSDLLQEFENLAVYTMGK